MRGGGGGGGGGVPKLTYATIEQQMYLVRSWIVGPLREHPELDPAHESLLLAAREMTNTWIDSKPSDKQAWLNSDGCWKYLAPSAKPLYARLAILFSGLDEAVRNAVILTAGPTVLGLVREAGTEEDYIVYDVKLARIFRYAALDTLCENTLIKELGRDAGIYLASTTAPTPAPTPIPAPAPAPTPQPHQEEEEVVAKPAPPIRAKKPPASSSGGGGGGKKRAAASSSAANVETPASSLKKPALDAVGLVEESSGETAK